MTTSNFDASNSAPTAGTGTTPQNHIADARRAAQKNEQARQKVELAQRKTMQRVNDIMFAIQNIASNAHSKPTDWGNNNAAYWLAANDIAKLGTIAKELLSETPRYSPEPEANGSNNDE